MMNGSVTMVRKLGCTVKTDEDWQTKIEGYRLRQARRSLCLGMTCLSSESLFDRTGLREVHRAELMRYERDGRVAVVNQVLQN